MTHVGRLCALVLLVCCVSWGPLRITELHHRRDLPVRLLRPTLTAC